TGDKKGAGEERTDVRLCDPRRGDCGDLHGVSPGLLRSGGEGPGVGKGALPRPAPDRPQQRGDSFRHLLSAGEFEGAFRRRGEPGDVRLLNRKSTRLNSSHVKISYAVFCLKKKNGRYCDANNLGNNILDNRKDYSIYILVFT